MVECANKAGVARASALVEAVINPVVATLFPNEKTKWLNILHAGWPGGLVLGGRDGRMATYGAMVAVAALTLWWRGFVRR